jgi:REP element-mobilizing transposase RayT
MARPLRVEFPGALDHITSRGNAGQAIFLADQDRLSFLEILAQVVKRYRFRCYAYCLMDNHYHLLLETPQGNLSRGMRQLNGVYTQAFNQRYRRSGTPGSTWQWWSTATGWRRWGSTWACSTPRSAGS